jgi:hypothetical protein
MYKGIKKPPDEKLMKIRAYKIFTFHKIKFQLFNGAVALPEALRLIWRHLSLHPQPQFLHLLLLKLMARLVHSMLPAKEELPTAQQLVGLLLLMLMQSNPPPAPAGPSPNPSMAHYSKGR